MSIWDRDWYVDEVCRRMGWGSSKRVDGGYGSRSARTSQRASRPVFQDGVKMPPQWTRPARNASRFRVAQRQGLSKVTVFALGVGAGFLIAFAMLCVARGVPPSP